MNSMYSVKVPSTVVKICPLALRISQRFTLTWVHLSEESPYAVVRSNLHCQFGYYAGSIIGARSLLFDFLFKAFFR